MKSPSRSRQNPLPARTSTPAMRRAPVGPPFDSTRTMLEVLMALPTVVATDFRGNRAGRGPDRDLGVSRAQRAANPDAHDVEALLAAGVAQRALQRLGRALQRLRKQQAPLDGDDLLRPCPVVSQGESLGGRVAHQLDLVAVVVLPRRRLAGPHHRGVHAPDALAARRARPRLRLELRPRSRRAATNSRRTRRSTGRERQRGLLPR